MKRKAGPRPIRTKGAKRVKITSGYWKGVQPKWIDLYRNVLDGTNNLGNIATDEVLDMIRIAQGTSANTRTGNEIYIKNIFIKIGWPDTVVNDYFSREPIRFCIVLDKSPAQTGSLTPMTDALNANQTLWDPTEVGYPTKRLWFAFPNMYNSRRLRLVKDFVFNQHAGITEYYHGTFPHQRRAGKVVTEYKHTFPGKGLKVTFGGSTAGPADVQNNQLLLMRSSSGSGGGLDMLTIAWRITFHDC